MTRKGALLSDCDGVLVHSEPLNFRCWNQAFSDVVGVRLEDEDYSQLVGLDMPGIYRLWCGDDATSLTSKDKNRLLDRKQHLFRELAPEGLEPMPGARALLETARRRGMGVAVVSAALGERLRFTLEVLGLNDLVELSLAGETILPGNRKDFARAARELGCDPTTSVAVDDSPSGVAAARFAGVGDVAGFVSTFKPELLLEAGANRVVADLRDVLE